MVGIVLEGQAAITERQRLLEDGKEVPLSMWERDARGRKRALRLQFGLNASTAWVFCQDKSEGLEQRETLEEVLVHEAAALFAGYLERMELRRCLVDPSPLSAELVDINPSPAHMAEDLKVVFGINVPLS